VGGRKDGSRQQATERCGDVIARLAAPAAKVARLLEAAEEDLLGFYAFPAGHWLKLRSTNPLERVNREIGQRADVVGIFPNDASAIRLAGAPLIEQNDERLVSRRYLSDESLAPAQRRDPRPARGGDRRACRLSAGAREKPFHNPSGFEQPQHYYDNTDERYTTSDDLTQGPTRLRDQAARSRLVQDVSELARLSRPEDERELLHHLSGLMTVHASERSGSCGRLIPAIMPGLMVPCHNSGTWPAGARLCSMRIALGCSSRAAS